MFFSFAVTARLKAPRRDYYGRGVQIIISLILLWLRTIGHTTNCKRVCRAGSTIRMACRLRRRAPATQSLLLGAG
jgi:hypothetical protein